MPVEILKASVGEYSVNSNSRGVTVNQHWLGDAFHDWGQAKPVHEWYRKNPQATVAQVAEQLDKLPKKTEVCRYKVYLADTGYLCVLPPTGNVCNPSYHKVRSMRGDDDPVVAYLRKHYNGNNSKDVAECARLIREYLEPKELVVRGYKIIDNLGRVDVVGLDGQRCNPCTVKSRAFEGKDCPVIAYLRTVMTPVTTVRETAKLIEDFLGREVLVRGVRVYRYPGSSVTGTAGAHTIPGLYDYLESHNKSSLSVPEVAKLIEDYREPVTIWGATVKMTAKGTEVENGPKGFFWYIGQSFDTVVANLKAWKPAIKVTIETGGDIHRMDSAELAIELLRKLV